MIVSLLFRVDEQAGVIVLTCMANISNHNYVHVYDKATNGHIVKERTFVEDAMLRTLKRAIVFDYQPVELLFSEEDFTDRTYVRYKVVPRDVPMSEALDLLEFHGFRNLNPERKKSGNVMCIERPGFQCINSGVPDCGTPACPSNVRCPQDELQ